MILLLHDRVSEMDMDMYNAILRVFVESIVESHVPLEVAAKVQRIPFYIAMMAGD